MKVSSSKKKKKKAKAKAVPAFITPDNGAKRLNACLHSILPHPPHHVPPHPHHGSHAPAEILHINRDNHHLHSLSLVHRPITSLLKDLLELSQKLRHPHCSPRRCDSSTTLLPRESSGWISCFSLDPRHSAHRDTSIHDVDDGSARVRN